MNQYALQEQSSLQGGKYRIIRVLGQGGFGITYLAEQTMLHKQFAIKEFFIRDLCSRVGNITVSAITQSDMVEQYRQKFIKEARRISILKNPHVVSVHDLFEENGTEYYVMDYIDGENLAEKQKRLQQPLSEKEVMGYLPQILDALECVHQKGIWHLDLKPANIMVDRQDNVTLIDFGASKQRSSAGGATTSTAVSFTNGFAPREQMEQNLDKFGPWTDFYALGATLYNLLTNKKPPLPSDIDDDRTADKHLALPMPQDISEKTKQLILWLMRTDRLDRPQSVEQIRISMFEDGIGDKMTESLDLDDETVVVGKTKNQDEKITKENEQAAEIIEDIVKPWWEQYWMQVFAVILALAAVLIALVLVYGMGANDEIVFVITAIFILGEFTYFYSSEQKKETITISPVIDNLVANMVHVEGGTFIMGATSEQDSDAYDDEAPAHQVMLSSFSIGRYEVTQEEWQAVMGSNPSYFEGEKRPVEQVSWDDCQEFIRKLNVMTGKAFRLPTEAEWEFAARGGNGSRGYKYAGSNDIDSVAWYSENSGSKTHPVGKKNPNELGLYDMSGNVWEWCSDWYGNYSSSSFTNPIGASLGPNRVYRGGSWYSYARNCRVSERSDFKPDFQYCYLGLRLVM